MAELLLSLLETAQKVAISGHMRPDGDCAGSCLALWNYLRDNRPDIQATVFLEPLPASFSFLNGAEKVCHQPSEESFDAFISLDAADPERLGSFREMFERSGFKLVVDHHVTNRGFGNVNFIEAESSSTCELLYTLLDENRISLRTAECLYLGIVHDTGVFKYSSTSLRTMLIAGKCLEKGVSSVKIIDDTFYTKSFAQNKAVGLALQKAELRLEGRMIVSFLTRKERESLGLSAKELDCVIDQLRITEGTEAALFLYELDNGAFKASLRSNGEVDVAAIALKYGGGGHAKAAGCDLFCTPEEAIDRMEHEVKEQL